MPYRVAGKPFALFTKPISVKPLDFNFADLWRLFGLLQTFSSDLGIDACTMIQMFFVSSFNTLT